MNKNTDPTIPTPPPSGEPQDTGVSAEVRAQDMKQAADRLLRDIIERRGTHHTIDRRDGFNQQKHVSFVHHDTVEPDMGETPALVLPPGHTAITYPQAIRHAEVRGTITVNNRDNFIAYLRRYCTDPAKLAVYAVAGDKLTITAILDHHDAGASGGNHHQVKLMARLSPIMKRWKPLLNVWLDQDKLVEFAEAEARYFTNAAALKQMALHFEVDESMSFSRKVNPTNGTSALNYTTKQNSNGAVPVPETLTAVLPIYDGGPNVTLVLVPRYKVPGGKLSFMLYLPDLDDILLREFEGLLTQIREDIFDFDGEGWDKVMVIGGEPAWNQTTSIAPVEHKGLPLPPPVVAAGSPSDPSRRY